MPNANKIIEVAEARICDYPTHQELAARLEKWYGYARNQMVFEIPQDDTGEFDVERIRVVVYQNPVVEEVE